MDAELLELQRQFEFAQSAKSSVRLSERNVVELVQKLQELRILDFDILHTVSGKEYITPDQLRREIANEVERRGRVSLIDLAEITGVDLYHVEKHAIELVSDKIDLSGTLLIQGEIISQSYLDNVAEEINERLQECSQMSVADIAAQLNMGSELVSSMLELRLGTLVKGRLEGGKLYTPAYVTRVSAMVRGAARGVGVPLNLSALWSNLQQLLHEMDGASGMTVETSFFQSLFNALVREKEVLGTLRAGTHWTPTAFATAQRQCVDSLYSQNSYVSYDELRKLGISQSIPFLQSRYPEGVPLASAFAHVSFIEMVDAAVEDAIERNSWIDCCSVLPTSFVSQDASKILSLCPSIQASLKDNKGVIFGDSYVFSTAFVEDIYGRIEKELVTFTFADSSTGVSCNDSVRNLESNETVGERKKKKIKSASTKGMEALDPEDSVPKSSRKKQGRNKDAAPAATPLKSVSKKESAKTKEENLNIPSEKWIMEKILTLCPDFEEQGGGDPNSFLGSLANQMKPKIINFIRERRKAMFTENSEKIKLVLDNLQKKLDESGFNIQLFEKAIELFEDDQAICISLHKHLLRTVGAFIIDTLFVNLDLYHKLKNGSDLEEAQNINPVSLTNTERIALAKCFPSSLSRKAIALAEAAEGKSVQAFMITLEEVAEESGLVFKKLNKKLERTLLHAYRKDLLSQVASESDLVAVLPKVVSLLYIQVYSKALQAPGRAISVAVSRLRDKLDDSAFKILTDYQTATVALLSLQAAATGDEEDCTSDRILTKREYLESQMPALRSLVISTSQA